MGMEGPRQKGQGRRRLGSSIFGSLGVQSQETVETPLPASQHALVWRIVASEAAALRPFVRGRPWPGARWARPCWWRGRRGARSRRAWHGPRRRAPGSLRACRCRGLQDRQGAQASQAVHRSRRQPARTGGCPRGRCAPRSGAAPRPGRACLRGRCRIEASCVSFSCARRAISTASLISCGSIPTQVQTRAARAIVWRCHR